MAGITLAQAQAKLDLWMAADDAVARNQEYEMPGGRRLTRADAKVIAENIDRWNERVKTLAPGGGVRVLAGVPTDS